MSMTLAHRINTAILTLCGACAFANWANAQRAVSEPNGKLAIVGGHIGGTETRSIDASLALPLGHRYGLQIDLSAGEYRHAAKGLGGQFFWRDPNRGLLGLSASAIGAFGFEVQRFGAQAEWYASRWTLGATAGQQEGDLPTRGYGSIWARYYPTEQLGLQITAQHADGSTYGSAALEWQPARPALRGLTFFANMTGLSGSTRYLLFGARYYFGETKSLLRRHREDDPASVVAESLHANAEALLQRRDAIDCTAASRLVASGGSIDIFDERHAIVVSIDNFNKLDCRGQVISKVTRIYEGSERREYETPP